jgi:hypothetical protein
MKVQCKVVITIDGCLFALTGLWQHLLQESSATLQKARARTAWFPVMSPCGTIRQILQAQVAVTKDAEIIYLHLLMLQLTVEMQTRGNNNRCVVGSRGNCMEWKNR